MLIIIVGGIDQIILLGNNNYILLLLIYIQPIWVHFIQLIFLIIFDIYNRK